VTTLGLSSRNALSYVLNNLRKHLGVRASRVGWIDPASSGRWFGGWREGIAARARAPALWRGREHGCCASAGSVTG
jgi:hypothetical protein